MIKQVGTPSRAIDLHTETTYVLIHEEVCANDGGMTIANLVLGEIGIKWISLTMMRALWSTINCL